MIICVKARASVLVKTAALPATVIGIVIQRAAIHDRYSFAVDGLIVDHYVKVYVFSCAFGVKSGVFNHGAAPM